MQVLSEKSSTAQPAQLQQLEVEPAGRLLYAPARRRRGAGRQARQRGLRPAGQAP